MNVGIRSRRRIRGLLRTATVAGLAVAASATALAAPAVSAVASSGSARATDPTITILTSGDRTSSINGNTGTPAAQRPTGGAVTGADGVTYRVFSGSSATGTPVGACTSGRDGNPAGQCTVSVPSTGTYTIEQYSAPTSSNTPQDNYFLSPTLGVGTVSATTSNVTSHNYKTLTLQVPASGVTVPAPSTAAGPNTLTARSGRWAVSRYNAMPPAACGRRIALVFDLSASISDQYLADYKTAARAYVDALVGSATSVTMYAFGTTAPIPSTVSNSPVNPTRAFDMNNPADVTAARNWITNLTRPASQYTNWDRGLWQTTTAARGAGSQPYNEAIMLTDGDPTAMSANGTPDAATGATVASRFRSVEAGIFSANALKAEGTRVVAVGLEAHETPGSVDNLKAISGPTAGSLATPEKPGDYFVVPFDELKTLLEEKALADCARLTVNKTVQETHFTHVGQLIHYSYTVKNDSPRDGFALSNIRVWDDKLNRYVPCDEGSGPLAPQQIRHCTGLHAYKITQADMDRGYVLNTATAHGNTANGTPVESPPDQEDVAGLQDPSIHVTKLANPTEYTEGTQITYRYTVKNDGNVTLHNVTATDDKFGALDCGPTPLTLIPDQSVTCTSKTHTATLADVEAASIRNEVTAKGTTKTNRTVHYNAVEVVNARFTPAIKVTKTADPSTYHLNTPITYTYTVKNTGDVTLHNVTVTDDKFGAVDCGPTPLTLIPDQSVTCTSKTHDATQADVDAGSIHNEVTATGTGPGGAKPKDEAEQTVYATHAPGIKVTKAVSPEHYTEGTPITYTYTVQNTGNVTLRNVTVTDDRLGTIDCTPTTLAPSQSATCASKTHIATTEDVAAKHLQNEVTATGTDPSGEKWTDQAEEKVFADGTPGIRVTKEVSPEHYTEGTTLPYTYTVQNIGDVTLTNLSVVDTVLGTITCTPTVLAPGESATCTEATYTADAADIAAGSIHNEVKATGDAPDGTPVDDEAERTVFAETTRGIRVTKIASPDTYTEGTPITYTYTVQNTGDVTLRDLTVVDTKFGPISCTPTVLAPGASATCTGKEHTATTDDIAAGSIHNEVSATGTEPGGEKITDDAEQTVFPRIAPAIEVTKSASPRTFDRPGQVITYTYVITNTGDVTLHSVDLTDSVFGNVTCPQTVLAPGASMTCTHTHTITQADIDGGVVSNAATATGTAPDGQIVMDDPPEEINAGHAAAIEITKTARPTVYSRHGELITYTYRVANQGNVTLRDVVLSDSRYGTIACPRTVLAPGEAMTCTRTHAISAVDLDEGSIFNSAAATAQPPSGNRTRSEPANATVRGVAVPAPAPPAPPAPPVPPVVPVTG